MAVERCERCSRPVDLDWKVEDMHYLPMPGSAWEEAVCTWCLTPDELTEQENS
jgi:hypothetical protein